MDADQLPQTLILPPDTSFEEIRTCLAGLGFTQSEIGTVTAPLVAGEPELANWNWYGELPWIQYSFNAVVRLRLLEVATLPPDLRQQIAEQLKPLSNQRIHDALQDSDDRMRLFGIWAAIETERIDLIHPLTSLYDQAEGLVKDEAEKALHRLGDLANARLEMQSGARMICDAATRLIRELTSADDLYTILPDEKDCFALFDRSIAAEVWTAVQRRGKPTSGLRWLPAASTDVTAAPAGAMRWSNELSTRFPHGYRNIAGWLEPSRIWLTWTGKDASGRESRMDGLVFVNGHWTYCPKPYRLLESLILQIPDRGNKTAH